MNHPERAFSRDLLTLDASLEIDRICDTIRRQVGTELHRRGVVLSLFGDVGSAVTAALCTRALGPERVLALFLPERESPADRMRLGKIVAERLGVRSETWDITAMLDAAGCYERRDRAVRMVLPEYVDGWRCKIEAQGVAGGSASLFHIVAEAPTGAVQRVRLTPESYLALLSALNLKERTRKVIEYHYADRYTYAVASAPNRLDRELGLFIKHGGGAGDLRPISHLYATQVSALAGALDVPEELRQRLPAGSSPLEQTRSESHFSMPLENLELCLLGVERGEEPAVVAKAIGRPATEVEEAYRAILTRRRYAEYLNAPPLPVEDRAPQPAN